MHLTTDIAQRARRGLRRSGARRTAGSRRAVSAVVSVIAVTGTVTGAVLATTGGKPPAPAPDPAALAAPSTRPAPAGSSGPVVPLLGGAAAARTAVPVTRGQADGTRRQAAVAPLRGLREADLLVVAPFSLPRQVLAAVSRQPAVTGAEPVDAARVQINGVYTAVLGVNPSAFRAYAARPTAASTPLWQGVADGGVAVSYTMGTLDRLSLGGRVTVAGRRQERLPVVAFGTVGIGGVDAVVSDSVARSLGMPAANAVVISAPPASVAGLTARVKALMPHGAAVEPLVTLVTKPSVFQVSPAGATLPGASQAGPAMTAAQLAAALRAAASRVGMPYVWGAAGPAAFDCSGLVQWSFAQAGVSMPRVAADQARTGPAVPVSQLRPGDLLFYYTDPTAPGYISHVAIYLGSGWMIEAPQPGMDVHVVPANFGPQYAGAVRVDPQLAAAVAAGLA